jgi:hypothetical protein
MFSNKAPLIFQKKIMIHIKVFESNFCSPFIKDSIKGTPKNVKKGN